MKARIKWIEKMGFVAESDSGHAVVIDAAAEVGGRNLGVRPMEMVLMGLGGCTAIDVMSILRKARQAVSDCVIELEAERSETVPKVFTRIHLRYIVSGQDLSEKHVARAVELSAQKYCSVSKMLEQSVALAHSYEIRPVSGESGD